MRPRPFGSSVARTGRPMTRMVRSASASRTMAHPRAFAIMAAMTTRTRIRLYRGATAAAAQERLRDDAVWALADGWYPAQWAWDGVVLRVVYKPTPDGSAARPATGKRRVRWRPSLTRVSRT